MKKPWLAALMFPSLVSAQYYPWSAQVTVNSQGLKAGSYAQVYVCPPTASLGTSASPCSPNNVTLYNSSSATASIAQPVTADGNGNYTFFTNPGSYYVSECFGHACHTYPVTLEHGAPMAVNAASFPGSDICAQITAAVSYANANPTVNIKLWIPDGNYTLASTCQIISSAPSMEVEFSRNAYLKLPANATFTDPNYGPTAGSALLGFIAFSVYGTNLDIHGGVFDGNSGSISGGLHPNQSNPWNAFVLHGCTNCKVHDMVLKNWTRWDVLVFDDPRFSTAGPNSKVIVSGNTMTNSGSIDLLTGGDGGAMHVGYAGSYVTFRDNYADSMFFCTDIHPAGGLTHIKVLNNSCSNPFGNLGTIGQISVEGQASNSSGDDDVLIAGNTVICGTCTGWNGIVVYGEDSNSSPHTNINVVNNVTEGFLVSSAGTSGIGILINSFTGQLNGVNVTNNMSSNNTNGIRVIVNFAISNLVVKANTTTGNVTGYTLQEQNATLNGYVVTGNSFDRISTLNPSSTTINGAVVVNNNNNGNGDFVTLTGTGPTIEPLEGSTFTETLTGNTVANVDTADNMPGKQINVIVCMGVTPYTWTWPTAFRGGTNISGATANKCYEQSFIDNIANYWLAINSLNGPF